LIKKTLHEGHFFLKMAQHHLRTLRHSSGGAEHHCTFSWATPLEWSLGSFTRVQTAALLHHHIEKGAEKRNQEAGKQ